MHAGAGTTIGKAEVTGPTIRDRTRAASPSNARAKRLSAFGRIEACCRSNYCVTGSGPE
jgi:hypothetical protein